MDIFTVLKNNDLILVDDPCENKKTRKIINQLNHNLADIMDLQKEFNEFKDEQMEGDYKRKAVIAKTLLQQYMNWQPMVKAYAQMEKGERAKVDRFYSEKSLVLKYLNTLLKDCKKLPVVCLYDVYGEDYRKCEEGHPMIVLGDNNTAILKSMIANIEMSMHVKGCLEEIDTTALSVNFVNVNTNVTNCRQKLEEMYADNPSKYQALSESISIMEEVGKRAVLFSTYKDNMMEIGVSEKDINAFENGLAKEYMPYKKQLKKAFNIEFVEINDLVVNEDLFATAGEKGYKPDFKTYDVSEVKFITDESVQTEQPAPQPKPAGFNKLTSINNFLNKTAKVEAEQPVMEQPMEEIQFVEDNTAGVEEYEQPVYEDVPSLDENEPVQPQEVEEVAENGRRKSKFGKKFDKIAEEEGDIE